MSRGLSRLQRAAVGLLTGTLPRRVHTAGSELTTGELLEELQAHGVIPDDDRRKQHIYTVRRACVGLVRRGHLTGSYRRLCHPPCGITVAWSAGGVAVPPPKKPRGRRSKGK